jgi:hypothetical protein
MNMLTLDVSALLSRDRGGATQVSGVTTCTPPPAACWCDSRFLQVWLVIYPRSGQCLNTPECTEGESTFLTPNSVIRDGGIVSIYRVVCRQTSFLGTITLSAGTRFDIENP